MDNKNTGIYKITNIINNHCYIGSAVNLNRRWITHKYNLNAQKHHSSYFQNAWNLYGSKSFTFEILLYCDKKDLILYEQRAIDEYKPEYNMCPTAGSSLGRKLSEEHKAKISAAGKGKKHTEESKQLMSQNRKGKANPPEACARQAEKLRGRKNGPHSEETKAKISRGNLGKKLSEETKQQLSDIAKARNMSGENNPNYGKKHSEETKKKMSETKKLKNQEKRERGELVGGNRLGSTASQETKDKISAATKGRKVGPYSEERRRAISEGMKKRRD